MCGCISRGSREVLRLSAREGAQTAPGSQQTHAGDARAQEVRHPHSTEEAPNNVAEPTAEVMEGRGVAKGNSFQHTVSRTQGRTYDTPSALERVRLAAQRDRRQRFTALLHHVVSVDRLRAAYGALRRAAAAGLDGTTWRQYGAALEANLQDLSARLRRGAYRAKPVRRAYIPKADGRQRPLGVPTLEDKIVQRAVVEVVNAIYETDFFGFSYGFRPTRSPHLAVDALSVGLLTKKVNWVLDADIRGFFDTLDHGWLVTFVERRVGDRRVVRLIKQWLAAGVWDAGRRTRSEVGTVQGGSISPLLANIYLHYVFDRWVHQWRRQYAQGDVIVVRFADDFVVGFERRADAERFMVSLRQRLQRGGLDLHPGKTRLIEFGRFAACNRRARGQGKPETFNFLGFTHSCATTREGKFTVRRQTMRQRLQATLRELRLEIRRRRHHPLPDQGRYLRTVVLGHTRYYGVPMNGPALAGFRRAVERLWWQALSRRGRRLSWTRMRTYSARWLPVPHICHPYPLVRLGVIP